MIEWVKRLFNPEPSSATARERLRLVLLSDHLALAPDVVESLKIDLIEVISKYVDVDVANCDVTFEQQERQVAMLANIPILGMKPRPKAPRPQPPAPEPPAPEPPALTDAAPASAAVADPPLAPPLIEAEPAGAPGADAAPKPRRRRRRRTAAKAAAAPG